MAKPMKVVILGDAKDAKKAFQEISAEANKTSGPLKSFGESLGGFATAAGGVALGVGAAVAGLFVKGFLDGVEAERLNDRLAAQLDLSDGDAAAAGGIAAEVYREAWGDSIGEVNDALKGVVQFLDADLSDASRDVTRGMVEDALTIADVWDQDVNEVIRSAAALMDSDLADSADEAFDIITTGLTDGADLNGDFLDTLFEYSTFFGQAGISAEQFLSALLVGTEAGMMGVDKVGDAVKEMSIRIQDGSTASRDALTDIGLDADEVAAAFAEGGTAAQDATKLVLDSLADMEDPLAQTQAAIALLGTPYEDLGELGPEVLEALADGTLEVRDTADVARDAYGNVATELESFKRKGTGALQDFVGAALQALVGGNGSLEDGLVRVNDWIDENQDDIIAWGREFGQAARDVYTELGPLIELLGDIGSWFAENGSEIAEWGGDFAFWVQVATAQLGPLMSILGAIQDSIEWINANLTGNKGTGKPTKWGGGGSTWGGGGGDLPVMHDGGRVPGPLFSEQLIVAQGGEYVTPIGGEAPGGGMNIVVNVAGSVVTEQDLVESVRQGLMRYERRNGQAAIR